MKGAKDHVRGSIAALLAQNLAGAAATARRVRQGLAVAEMVIAAHAHHLRRRTPIARHTCSFAQSTSMNSKATVCRSVQRVAPLAARAACRHAHPIEHGTAVRLCPRSHKRNTHCTCCPAALVSTQYSLSNLRRSTGHVWSVFSRARGVGAPETDAGVFLRV